MTVKEIIISELEDFPDEKVNSLLDYIYFLKYEGSENIPNKVTEKTFRDTDNRKNLNTYSSVNEFFKKMNA